jgi:hypothetical protein
VQGAPSGIRVDPRQLPADYWKYLLATALFTLGNSSNTFLILQIQDLGVSLSATIVIYAFYNVAATRGR